MKIKEQTAPVGNTVQIRVFIFCRRRRISTFFGVLKGGGGKTNTPELVGSPEPWSVARVTGGWMERMSPDSSPAGAGAGGNRGVTQASPEGVEEREPPDEAERGLHV